LFLLFKSLDSSLGFFLLFLGLSELLVCFFFSLFFGFNLFSSFGGHTGYLLLRFLSIFLGLICCLLGLSLCFLSI
jgi:hypothetical protein